MRCPPNSTLLPNILPEENPLSSFWTIIDDYNQRPNNSELRWRALSFLKRPTTFTSKKTEKCEYVINMEIYLEHNPKGKILKYLLFKPTKVRKGNDNLSDWQVESTPNKYNQNTRHNLNIFRQILVLPRLFSSRFSSQRVN